MSQYISVGTTEWSALWSLLLCVSNIHGIVVPKSNPFTWCS